MPTMHVCSHYFSCLIQDKVAAFQTVATAYIKYVLIFRKLEECYDQVNMALVARCCY